MSEQRAPQQNGCQCGMCFFLAMEGSKYCVAHRGIMESFDRKRAASLPESQPQKDFDALTILVARTIGGEEWKDADDSQILEEFDPWEALRKVSQPSPSGDEQRLRDLLQGLVKHFRDDFEDPGLELYGLVNGKELRVGGQMLNKLLAEAEAALQESPSDK